MKKALAYIAPLFLLSAFFWGCADDENKADAKQNGINAAHQRDSANYTMVKWLDSVQDFGAVIHGEKAKIVFHVMNTGDKPLYLTSVKPGCGCTLADYSKNAILPNQQGEVVAEYDSGHGSPNQEIRKTVTVKCNAKNASETVLVFTGKIKPKA